MTTTEGRSARLSATGDAHEELRLYWDRDARTYDAWPDHGPRAPAERAAWSSELARLLPPSPSRVLDVGAGTGFLTLAAARLGHEVTALDVSSAMLEQLAGSAAREGLSVTAIRAPADQPPSGPFDAVIERMAMWTLPDPCAALTAWRRVTVPGGRLLVVESLWTGGSLSEAVRRLGRKRLRRGRVPEHHAPYPPDLVSRLPLIRDPFPNRYIDEIAAAGWRNIKFTRLRDVEFARLVGMSRWEQLFGTNPQYVIVAEADGEDAELTNADGR